MTAPLERLGPPSEDEYNERILKLAEFLDTVTDIHFDFTTIWESESMRNDRRKYEGCGSIACAIGWSPEVFPDLFELKIRDSRRAIIHDSELAVKYPHYIPLRMEINCYIPIASHLYGMSESMAQTLFSPDLSDECDIQGLPLCFSTATAKEVAQRLRKFVELTQTKEIKRWDNVFASEM